MSGRSGRATFKPLKSMAGQFCYPTAEIAKIVAGAIAAAGYDTTAVHEAGNGWHTFNANVRKEFGARVAAKVLSQSELIETFGVEHAARLAGRAALKETTP